MNLRPQQLRVKMRIWDGPTDILDGKELALRLVESIFITDSR